MATTSSPEAFISVSVAWQSSNYAQCAMGFLVVHDYLINIGDELRYGGLFYAISDLVIIWSFGIRDSSMQEVWLNEQSTPDAILLLSLNGMIALRVYAMSGRPKFLLVVLLSLFIAVQVLNIVSTAVVVSGMHDFIVIPPGTCDVPSTLTASRLALASECAVLLYELILLILGLSRFAVHVRETWRASSGLPRGRLMNVMMRDNSFYFLALAGSMIASAFGSLQSSLGVSGVNLFAGLLNNVTALAAIGVITDVLPWYQTCLLGPTMMLSIRRYDAKLRRGNSQPQGDEEEAVSDVCTGSNVLIMLHA
ncbi:hypothetical protein CONPUDRAFT_77485 [Coniophora puteana RWD-64-598 SS2]|uniref:Uncharacterized protein n=1 Tax=Coniophora puteana (strain RWD-64-598) TaxID=741705 RepID=A0A5M3M7H2_CONPW|nr:uncharacterized protein CONPUDRAFT_77485 [Coniophora puteana RWD-64-598 SS2]EIW75242.1 hypothetical protein CONPUDRAFT_77485 [Coniophora puteana RWD-64-598 SS2]